MRGSAALLICKTYLAQAAGPYPHSLKNHLAFIVVPQSTGDGLVGYGSASWQR